MKKETHLIRVHSARHWLLAAIAALLLLLPFFFSTFPPATDIPQHFCQIHLLKETLAGKTHLYSINWFAPNNLIYLLVASIDALLAPPLSAKILLMILAIMWIASIYYLAWKLNRPLENAILATPLFYNLAFYWGFLNFLIGWPFFALLLVQSLKPMNKKNWILTCSLLFILYNCHALWFLVGSAFIFIHNLVLWKNKSAFFYRISTSLPTAMIAAVWFPVFSVSRESSGFDIAPYWITSPLQRITPAFITNTMLGGVRGYLEPIVAGAVLLWLLWALFTNRVKLMQKCNNALLTAALLFTGIMIFAPQKFMNTIFFAQRWFPCAVILLILAMPRPAFKRQWGMAYVMGIVVLFSLETSLIWKLFDKKELTGLQDSLIMLPEEQRVLGLDYIKNSTLIKGRPFMQMYAYAQVLKGGSLNFSFAEHSSGIVIYKNGRDLN